TVPVRSRAASSTPGRRQSPSAAARAASPAAPRRAPRRAPAPRQTRRPDTRAPARSCLQHRQDELQHPPLVQPGCTGDVDLLAPLDSAREAAVVDLHGLVTRAGRLWALPLPRDRKHSPCRRDLDRVGVDAGKLDDDVQGRWVVGAEAVTLGAEAATLPGER